MSDVSQPSAPPPSSPPPSSPPPQAPPQTEVPVNETPVNQPQPLGTQAPPKSANVARQEALENAFAKARAAQEEAAKSQPKKAPAKQGELALDAKDKKPTPQEAEKAQRYRESGKFARDPAKAEQPQVDQGQQPGQQPQAKPVQPLHETAPYRDPPPRFSEPAKAEWASTPESVRGAVDKLTRDFQGFYEKTRGDVGVMDELRPYHDLATKQGTSLRKAFDNYYNMEQKLRQDPIGGLDVIVQNLRIPGPDGRPITFQDMALHVASMTPEQYRSTAQQNQQSAADQRIGQLHQTVERQSQILDQMIHQQRFAGTKAQVDQFAAQHPRFDELADLIKSEIDLGFPLDVAYKRADMLRPNHTAPQTRNTSAQTRKTSISGAPDGNVSTRPSDGRPRGNGEAKHPTVDEALERAFRRVGNGV